MRVVSRRGTSAISIRLRAATSVGLAGLAALAAVPAIAQTPAPEGHSAAKRAPDLVVSALALPADAVAGRTIVVTETVRNKGRAAAPKSSVAYRLSLDKRLNAADPRLAATRRVKRLKPRKRSRGRVTLAIPAALPAAGYRLFACADAARKVRERNERNNCRRSARVLRVSAPPSTLPTPPGGGPISGPPSPSPTADRDGDRRVTPRRRTRRSPAGRRARSRRPRRRSRSSPPRRPPPSSAGWTPGASQACESPKVLGGLALGAHAFEVRAVDAADNRDASAAHRDWTVLAPDEPGGPLDPPADDPAGEAPALSAAQASGFADSTSFLWTGADPIQSGVETGALRPATVAVLRGRVLNRMGGGIGGVRVTVLDHPELGRTATRPDGRYDVAVGGGGPVTLTFERRGYITAQRQAEAPWQDYAAVADLVLVPYDTQVSEIALGAGDDVQVARGSAVTDTDGSRQATMLFAPDTDAELVLPDGTTEPLDQIHVRATEYTIGATGVDAMPAALPPTSGYTYAVELSADEAIAAGATDLRFDKPVATYVDNFLEFPVGGGVPVGYLDRATGQWVGAPDGRVIEIVGEPGGVAAVDGDGDGDADSATELAALGITAAEREQLAGLYEPGKSLWRVALTHFTPWDTNWAYAPPADTIPPPVPLPTADDQPAAEEGVLRGRLDPRLPEPAARPGPARGGDGLLAGLLERPGPRPARQPSARDPAHAGEHPGQPQRASGWRSPSPASASWRRSRRPRTSATRSRGTGSTPTAGSPPGRSR